MRLALGYKKSLPYPIDYAPRGNQMPKLVGECFPNHDVLFFCATQDIKCDANGIKEPKLPRNVEYCGVSTEGHDLDKHLWCFSYHVSDEDSHFVIGYPTSSLNIYQIYAIKL